MHIYKNIVAADGVSFNLTLTPQAEDSDLPVVLCLPAMGVPARKYMPLSEALHERGLSNALFEWRGIDSSSVRASRKLNFGYYELLHHDLSVAVDAVRQIYPNRPIYFLGHSLGGQLGLIYMTENPDKISGLIGVATGLPYYKAWPFPQDIGLWVASKLVRFVAACYGYYPGKRFGFAGREARQVMQDWAYSVIHGDYQINGSEAKIPASEVHQDLRALMITIDKDILAPVGSAKQLGDKLARSRVDYEHLVAKDFIGDSLGHFNWMKEPGPIVERVKHWFLFEK